MSLQKICWKSKPFEALDASHDKNFLLKHEAFVDPSYVIQVSKSSFSLEGFLFLNMKGVSKKGGLVFQAHFEGLNIKCCQMEKL